MDTGAAAMLGMFAFLAVNAWAGARREQREMELRFELYRRMLEHPRAEADAVRALLAREARQRQAAAVARKRRGGIIVSAVGIGFGTFLYYIAPDRPIYLLALVPTLVGLAVLGSGLTMARRSSNGGDDGTT